MLIQRSKLNQTVGLLGWILLAFGAATLGAFASIHAKDFYQQLHQPAWAPPAWLFGPVWSVLYLMMAISAWLVWRSRGFSGARPALIMFLLQLAANILWSWLFFAWHRGALASIEVMILWLLIFATILAFWRVQKLAAILLLPYLLWVTFATVLCLTIWRLNLNALS